MESEKVKEIKKALECCSTLMDNNATSEEQDNSCNECPYRLNDRCSWKLDSDALTLINELEKGNAKLLDSVETVQNNRCTTKCELTKRALKQFAEKIKDLFVEDDQIRPEIDKTLKEFINE